MGLNCAPGMPSHDIMMLERECTWLVAATTQAILSKRWQREVARSHILYLSGFFVSSLGKYLGKSKRLCAEPRAWRWGGEEKRLCAGKGALRGGFRGGGGKKAQQIRTKKY